MTADSNPATRFSSKLSKKVNFYEINFVDLAKWLASGGDSWGFIHCKPPSPDGRWKDCLA